jgi:hypothetical protein
MSRLAVSGNSYIGEAHGVDARTWDTFHILDRAHVNLPVFGSGPPCQYPTERMPCTAIASGL